MKYAFLILLMTFLTGHSSYAIGDQSELGSDLDQRVTNGCLEYAKKQVNKHLQEHFNQNSWAGGNVGSGSHLAMKEVLPNHESFLYS